MEKIFLNVLNMGITACWLIVAVLILRLVLRNVPKWVHCLLWAMVAIRLVCPFSFESTLSLIPSARTVSEDIMYEEIPRVSTGIPAVNDRINPVIATELSPNVGDSVNPMQIVVGVAAVIWLVGLAVMLLYATVSYLRLKYKLKTAVPLQENIRQSEWVKSPFILGMVRPKIYIPYTLKEENRLFVIAHENAHISRFDHLSKPIAFAILCVHWFNPVIWVAYIMFCRDIELACDEKVIRGMEKEERKAYSGALVKSSISEKLITVCPLAFGEVGVKARIKRVMRYKKPTIFAIMAAVALCIVVVICLMTNPKDSKITELDYAKDKFSYIITVKTTSEGRNHEIYSAVGVQYVRDFFDGIIVNGKEIPDSLNEDRKIINRIILNNGGGSTKLIVYFNRECTEVWFDDGVKPSASYEVKNPEYVKVFFEEAGSELTLEKVKEIAKKGEDISWADFVMYKSDYTDSQVNTFLYVFDERCSLWVVGYRMGIKPDTVTFSNEYGSIDIRTESIEEFLAKYE